MTENEAKTCRATPESNAFLVEVLDQVTRHPTLNHPFLRRFSERKLTRRQLQLFATQHYMYSRFFIRNVAAVIANVPDEHARSLLILNIYEEIGEPLRLRDRVHFLLLEAGVVQPDDVGQACMEVIKRGNEGDVVKILLEKGCLTRAQVSQVVESSQRRAKDLTHPALFRRFLLSLGVTPEMVDRTEPLPETSRLVEEYRSICRNGHWLEGMGAMGPGTECAVPTMYTYLQRGIAQSGVLAPEDYIFWTIHIHCDEGHGKNIMDALRPYAAEEENQRRILQGARRVLDARGSWYDGLDRLLFG